jgi:hypothetical protein
MWDFTIINFRCWNSVLKIGTEFTAAYFNIIPAYNQKLTNIYTENFNVLLKFLFVQ